MTLWGGIGILWPSAALTGLAAVLAALFYAYRRRGRGVRVTVPTLLLLRQLQRQVIARKRFIPPLRFFFDLLIGALLVFAAAGMFREKSTRHIAIVIDNSLSLAARQHGQTLLDSATQSAASYLRYLGSDQSVKLFVTSPSLRHLHNDFLPPGEASAALKNLTPAFGTDNLEATALKLLADQQFDRVAVFSDRPLHLRSTQPEKLEWMVVRPASFSPGNLAVSGISLRENATEPGRVILTVTVAAFIDQPLEASLTATSFSDAGPGRVASSILKLPAHASGETQLELPLSPAYQVRVEAADPSRRLADDAIIVDNFAWIGTSSLGGKFAVVSEFSAATLGLNNLAVFSFTSLTPSQFLKLNAEQRDWWRQDRISGFIFHRFAGIEFPPLNSFFILPPAGSHSASKAPPKADIAVTRWNSAHPIATYLNFAALNLPSITPLEPSPWMEQILTTSAGAALLAGERAGRRHVSSGFEVLPYTGKENPFLSILLLNVLRWLSEQSMTLGFAGLGVQVPLPDGDWAVRWLAPDPNAVPPLINKLPDKEVIVGQQPGLALLRDKSGQTILQAYNYFSAEESDTLKARPVELPALPPGPAKAPTPGPLAPLFSRLVIALLLLEVLWLTLSPRLAQIGQPRERV